MWKRRKKCNYKILIYVNILILKLLTLNTQNVCVDSISQKLMVIPGKCTYVSIRAAQCFGYP